MKLPHKFKSIEEFAKSSCRLLIELQKWIYDIHPYDIYTNEEFLLQNFESSWIEFLENTPINDVLDILSSLMLGEKPLNATVLPKSFTSLMARCKEHWLPFPEEEVPVDSLADCTKKGMKVKKLHEVKILSTYICQLAEKLKIECICDFGSGLGYLSHEISKKYPVIAIECDPKRTEAAKARTERLSKREGIKGKEIKYTTEYLTVDNSQKVFATATEGKDSSMLLTGLHACGDLSASTMLGLFKHNPSIKAVVSVGCCYHLMNTCSFPKSDLLKDLNLAVDKRALRLGCHTFVGFDKSRVLGLWKSQLFRAITQVEGRIVMNEKVGLQENLFQIEKKHNLPHSDITLKEMERGLKNIAMLSLIRCHLGPLVEGLVLLDRYLNLHRSFPNSTFLVPLFNPKISPRNHAIVSFKIDS